MTAERHILDQLGDLLDGRVSAEHRTRVEEHLASCATCHLEWERLQGTRELLRRTADEAAVPTEITARVMAALDREGQRPIARGRWRRWAVAAMGAAAVIAIAFVLMRKERDFPTAAASDYAAVRTGEMPLEFRVSDPAELERWFSQRVEFQTRVFDFAMMQYELQGGRVDSLRGRRSALFAYRDASGNLIVCEMYQGRTAELPPPAEVRNEKEIEFLIYERNGTTVVFWQEGPVVCVLAGAGAREDVISLAFAKAMKV